jgi:uncharacterized protein YbaR (Trm112 family)
MPLSAELKAILSCPICKGELFERSDIVIICNTCRLQFEIRGGIPVMFPDEATPKVV